MHDMHFGVRGGSTYQHNDKNMPHVPVDGPCTYLAVEVIAKLLPLALARSRTCVQVRLRHYSLSARGTAQSCSCIYKQCDVSDRRQEPIAFCPRESPICRSVVTIEFLEQCPTSNCLVSMNCLCFDWSLYAPCVVGSRASFRALHSAYASGGLVGNWLMFCWFSFLGLQTPQAPVATASQLISRTVETSHGTAL